MLIVPQNSKTGSHFLTSEIDKWGFCCKDFLFFIFIFLLVLGFVLTALYTFVCPTTVLALPSSVTISEDVNPSAVAVVYQVSAQRGGVMPCGWMLKKDVVRGPSVSNVRFGFLWPNHFSMGAQRRLGSPCSPLQDRSPKPHLVWLPTTPK